MRKFFKRIAAFLITVYARRILKQAVTLAEMRHEEEKETIYIITSPEDERKLRVINEQEFLDLRHQFRIPSKKLPLWKLKNHCWYHTANASGKGMMSDKDREVRRLAFIRHMLKNAKLA